MDSNRPVGTSNEGIALPTAIPDPVCPINRRLVIDFIEYLEKLAEESGAKIEIISADNEDGYILLKSFGGLAAILREKKYL